jgi:hypothetical protein
MKTAISIPDDVFAGAERLARRTKKSRSKLFSDAVREYLARHNPEEVTEAMNRVCAEVRAADEFTSLALQELTSPSAGEVSSRRPQRLLFSRIFRYWATLKFSF